MLNKLFKLSSSKTTVQREILAGLTTFMTMSYIIFVNPDILSNTGMPKEALITATCLAAAFASILMGLYANYPIGLASSMTANSFFAFVIVKTMGLSWQEGLAAVFIVGILFIIKSQTIHSPIITKAINEYNINFKNICIPDSSILFTKEVKFVVERKK